MNEIVVGIKPIAGAALAGTDEEATAAVGAVWLTIDGREIACAKDGGSNLIKVVFEMDAGPCTATVTLIGSSLRTARWDDPEVAPDKYKRKD